MNNPNNNSPVFNALVDNIANVESIKAAAIERLKEKASLEDMELVRECNGFLAEIEQAKLNASEQPQVKKVCFSRKTWYPFGRTETKLPTIIVTREGDKTVIRLWDEDGNSTCLYGGEATLEVMN